MGHANVYILLYSKFCYCFIHAWMNFCKDWGNYFGFLTKGIKHGQDFFSHSRAFFEEIPMWQIPVFCWVVSRKKKLFWKFSEETFFLLTKWDIKRWLISCPFLVPFKVESSFLGTILCSNWVLFWPILVLLGQFLSNFTNI